MSDNANGRRLPPAAARAKKLAEEKTVQPVEENQNTTPTTEVVEMPHIDEFVKVEDPMKEEVSEPTETTETPVVEDIPVVIPATTEEVKVETSEPKAKNPKAPKPVKIKKNKKLTKGLKKVKKGIKKAKRHYWWRYLLVFLAGVIFVPVAIAGTAVAATALFTTSQVMSLVGLDPSEYLNEKYHDKTLLQLIMDIIDGKVTFNNLNGIRELTPYVDVLIDEVVYFLNENIGFELSEEGKDRLYSADWATIPTVVFEELQTGIKLGTLLGVNENSSSVLIYLAYEVNEDGTTNWDKQRTLGSLMNNMDSIINNAKIGDLIDVGTSGILYNLRDVKVGEMAYEMEHRPLNQIIDIPSDAFPALAYLGQYPVSGLNDALNNATLEQLLPIEEDSILYALKDKKLSEIPEEIQHLTLGEVIEIDENSPKILQFLKDTPIDQITSAIDTMPLDVAIEIDENSPKFLRTLAAKGATINNIGSMIGTLTLSDMVDIGSSRILNALAGSTLDSIASDVDNLTLGDVVDPDAPGSPKILKALAGYKISELGDAIHNLKIEEIIDIGEDAPMILKALKGTNFEDLEAKIHTLTIGDLFTAEEIADCIFLSAMGASTKVDNFADRINELTFIEVFGDIIFENPNDPSTIKPTWKYLFMENGTLRTDYKIAFDMEHLINNLTNNFRAATLRQLYNDGFIDLGDPTILDKTFMGTKIGDYTMESLLNTIGSLAY